MLQILMILLMTQSPTTQFVHDVETGNEYTILKVGRTTTIYTYNSMKMVFPERYGYVWEVSPIYYD